ncbi:MAG: FHA domain-containing protein [Coriobacteriia bacterium]|nr:FHA domain-containing protein [Coriobacteriia bacterium]
MESGQTFIEINYDYAWVRAAIEQLATYGWLFEWGMYVFLIGALGIAFWIFFDSANKNKGAEAMAPRIMSMVGFFLIIPAFIFRFTGTSDGITRLVRLNAEQGAPYYSDIAINVSPQIPFNVNWLVSGYGSAIALLALLGVLVAIAAMVLYASKVQRARPSTEFMGALNNKFTDLERQMSSVKSAVNNTPSSASTMGVGGGGSASPNIAATVIDRRPAAATIIDRPKSGATLNVIKGAENGRSFNLPQMDVVIGRDPKCFVPLTDGKSSRQHAKLLYNGGSWMLVDQGSANGTYYNSSPVSGQQPLASGDIIGIGDTELQFNNQG